MSRSPLPPPPAGPLVPGRHSVFDGSPLGTLVVRDHRVVSMNDAAVALLGVSREAMLGHPFTEFVEPEAVARMSERHEARRRGEPVPAIYQAPVSTRPGGLTVEVFAWMDGEDTVVQMRDTGDPALRREKVDGLARLGVAIQRELSAQAIFSRLCEGLAALGLAVLRLEPDGEGFRVAGAFVEPSLREKLAGLQAIRVRRPLSPLLEQAWRDGASFTDDAPLDVASAFEGEQADRWLPLAAAGLTRGAAVRVDVRGVPSALLLVLGGWLTLEDRSAFRLLAAQASSALDAALAIADLSRRNGQLAALNRLAALAGSTADLPSLFQHGTKEVSEVMGSVAVAIYLLDAEGKTASLAWQHGGSPEAGKAFARIPIDSPLTLLAPVVRSGQARVWNRLDYPEPARSMIASMGQEVIASVPLISRSTVVGVMNVAFDHQRKLELSELELLKAIGSHFGAAVEAQHLLDDLRGRIAELGLLAEVGRSLVATLEPGQVLDLGVRNLARSVGGSGAFLLLCDPSGKSLVIRAVAGPHAELLGRALSLSTHSVAASAFLTRSPVMVENALEDPRVDQTVRGLTGGRAYLALPLIVRDAPIGVVVIIDAEGQHRYTQVELERASAIANQLAVAVENARLYADLRASYEALARAQAQSLHQERLAALGELSAVVAHEVRNPLAVIFNSLSSLNQLLKPSGDAAMLLSIVGQEADRLNTIVSDMLDFARPRTPALRPEPLERVLDDAINAAVGKDRPNIRLVREIDPALPQVPMDERLLRQAVLNIALNALQAMPNGGQLTVRAHTGTNARGPVACIELSDTGSGITADARAHIFEPFYTTRATGTGLGLALVKRIVDDHRGEVEVTSEVGRGTTFTVRLPLELPQERAQSGGMASATTSGLSSNILP